MHNSRWAAMLLGMEGPSSEHITGDPRRLPRVLGVIDAIALVVGSIIGSGVFLKANKVAFELGAFGPIVAVWVGIGLVTLFGSLTLAELAAMLPQAGGPYVYLREAYGRLPAFLWGWTEFWVVRTGSLGALACATVIYLNRIVPMRPDWQGPAAVALILLLTAVNWRSTRWGATVQTVTTAVKVGFLLILISLPFLLAHTRATNVEPVWPSSIGTQFWRAMGVAAIAVLWAYDGWINIAPLAEEIRHPQRNIPLALGIGILLIIVLYVAANSTYHLVLPMDQVIQSDAVASDVFYIMFGAAGATLAALGVMCSTFGATQSNMLTGPRIYFAMARDDLLSRRIAYVHHQHQTPSNAVLLQGLWASVLVVLVVLAGHRSLFRVGSISQYDVRHLGHATVPAALQQAFKDYGTPLTQNARLEVVTGESEWQIHDKGHTFVVERRDDTLTVSKRQHLQDAFNALTDFVIFGGSLFYALAVASVFVLRRRLPDLRRPYRTWGYPWSPLIYLMAFAGCLASMLWDSWKQSAAGSSLILAGIVYYFWYSRRGNNKG